MEGSAAVVEARRAPIQLGGMADRRFERRLAAVRRAARYLLLADMLGWVFVFTFHTYEHASAGVPDPVVNGLGYSLPILALLSLAKVVNGRVSREAIVAADAERVFALLGDPNAWVRLFGAWLGRYRGIDALETAASGGTKGRAKLTAFGLPGKMRWEMLEYQPPRRVVIFAGARWIGIPQLNLAIWSLTSTDSGVRVRLEQEYRYLGLVLASALTDRMLGWAASRNLARLKSEAERLS